MSTSIKDILVAARGKIATIATSRDVAVSYLEHKTNQPFDAAPIAARDGFEVVSREPILTSAWGLTGEKEGQFKMVVRLGHAAFNTDKERENLVAEDVERISDLLESFAFPLGTQIVLFEKAVTDKTKANWWLTEMFFSVVYVGTMRAA